MTTLPAQEEYHAHLALRLLLGLGVPTRVLAEVNWDLLTALAEPNAVLLRLADRLQALGARPPRGFLEAADRGRARAASALLVLRQVRGACRRHGIDWLLPKAAQRYPDLGDDLDLLVLPRTPAVDRLVLEELRVLRHRRTLAHRLGGSTVFSVPGSGIVLDIHHGRVGTAGRHADYSATLVQRGRVATIDATPFLVPSREDQLVLQGLEKVAGRRGFHLCDVLQTVITLRDDALDWDYVVDTARAQGGDAGLGCYLHYVDQVHREVVGGPLLSPEVRRALWLDGWGRVTFGHGAFRFPTLRVNGRVYARQFGDDVRAGRWGHAGRLCLLPLVAAAGAMARLRHVPAGSWTARQGAFAR